MPIERKESSIHSHKGEGFVLMLTIKGKKALNGFIKELGKAKGRKLFYSLEKNKPDWTKRWRKEC